MLRKGILALLLLLNYAHDAHAEDGFLVSFKVPLEPETPSATHSTLLSPARSTLATTSSATPPATPSATRIAVSVPEQRAQLDNPRFPIVHPVQQNGQPINADDTIATTMVTDTDFLGNPVTIPSTFVLEPSRKAFQSCIFGCSTVTVPCTTDTGSTVIVVLPLTIPCSLVQCPPCNTCISSTISITVCPVITTIIPPPATATIFTTAVSIATAKCQAMIDAAVQSVAARASEPIVVTVTRTRAPVGCPAASVLAGDVELVTSTLNAESVCSTFVVCQAKRFTCPLPAVGPVDGEHMIDTVQAILAGQPSSATPDQSTSETPTAGPEAVAEPTSAGSVAAKKMFQTNSAAIVKPLIFGPLLSALAMIALA